MNDVTHILSAIEHGDPKAAAKPDPPASVPKVLKEDQINAFTLSPEAV